MAAGIFAAHADLDAAEREVSRLSETYKEQTHHLLQTERALSLAIERRDAALSALDAVT